MGTFAALPPFQSVDRFVEAAADYIQRYQTQFEFLIADELSVQHAFAPVGSSGRTSDRFTRGEFFITYLDAERQWTTVRDIAEVDGVAVADRRDLIQLLRTESVSSVARRLFAWNARFNIGRAVRNFNDPMLALVPLGEERRRQFSFSVVEVDRSNPRIPLVTLGFQERDRPTLVRDTQGRSVFATGSLTIDTTGLVRRTTMAFDADGVSAALSTEFAANARIGLWLPTSFSERYVLTRDAPETTVCRSSYSNYRRFEVTARIR